MNPRPIPVEVKRRQDRAPAIWACRHCGKFHAYKDHDGVLQPCGFCCKSHAKGGD